MWHSVQLNIFIVRRVHGLSKSVKRLTWHYAVPRVGLLAVRITLLYTVRQ